MRFNPLCVAALAAVPFTGAVASAQPVSPPAPQVAGVINCRSLTNVEARLTCYDNAVGQLSQALANGDLVTLDRQSVAKERRGLFGFSLPRIGLLAGDRNSPEPKELLATIESAREVSRGKWLITLDTGARWQTTESLSGQAPPSPGHPIKIRRGAIGGFMASINGAPLRRIARVE